jgi:CheY-like chemotaxis protein
MKLAHMYMNKAFITLIEDDQDFGETVKTLIEIKMGIPIRHISDGLEGLIACLNEPPHLVILDLELPSMHGEEILRRLRTSPHTRSVPVIVCSAMPNPLQRELAMLQIGADHYFEKTVSHQLLLKTVAELLDQHQTPITSQPDGDESLPIGAPIQVEGRHKQIEEKFPHLRETNDPGRSETFAGYKLLGILGAGGMGTVYEGIHPELGRVAIKVLLKTLTTNPNAVERFLREEKTMRALDHPNIIRVLDSGRTAYSYYFSMELVRGESMDRLIDRCALSLPQKREVICQLFDAVIYLHQQSVLHRDLKPSNFILSNRGVVKVGDFGISWNPMFTPAQAARLTRDNSLVGTPAFMAPEQLSGAEASELTDQYSLARSIQCLIEDGRPAVPPKPLHQTRPELPMALSDALTRMLHIHAQERYPSLAEAKTAILSGLDEALQS